MPDAPRMSDELRPCDCEDWPVNLPILNAPLMLMHARNPSTTPGYTGKQFVFCPWCGLSRRAVPSGGVPDSERERLATKMDALARENTDLAVASTSVPTVSATLAREAEDFLTVAYWLRGAAPSEGSKE